MAIALKGTALGEVRDRGIAFARNRPVKLGTGSVRADDETAELHTTAPPQGR
ncbi:hypothetical protein [Streptomyces sp. NPDC055080]